MRPSQHWLNVDHGSTVDGFNGADSKASPSDSANDDRVKAEGIWAIGRSGGEYPGDRTAGIGTGMNFQYLAIRLMQPGDDDDLVTWVEAMERVSREMRELQAMRRVRLRFPALEHSRDVSGWTGLRRSGEAVRLAIDKGLFFRGIDCFFLPMDFQIGGHIPTSHKTGEKWGTLFRRPI